MGGIDSMAAPFDFGSRLREERRRQGLTLREVAELSGISVSQLSRLEHGHRRPDWDHLVSLSRALGVPAAYWFPDAAGSPPPRGAEAAETYAPLDPVADLWQQARQWLPSDDWEDIAALIAVKLRRRRRAP